MKRRINKIMDNFYELYHFLQGEVDFLDWISQPWKGKDKQESCLRLFAGLGLMEKLNKYTIHKGNFNMQTIKPASIKDLFFTETGAYRVLKDNGDSSDLTGIHEPSKTILFTSSKNLNHENAGKLDIEKLMLNFAPYEAQGYKPALCIAIRCSKGFLEMKSRMKKTSEKLQKLMNLAILIDWQDLLCAHKAFLRIYSGIKPDDLTDKKPLLLKPHQLLGVEETLTRKTAGVVSVLWGHIPRSGKSYIMAGCIAEIKTGNFLIITTAPKETITQYMSVFSHAQFKDFTVVGLLKTTVKKPVIGKNNIFICSKQFLQNKRIAWLQSLLFSARFIDESHNGGTTDLAKSMLDAYGKDAFTVYITATYSKPAMSFGISKSNWILWSMEDVIMAKNFSTRKQELFETHPKLQGFSKDFNDNSIEKEYGKYPAFWLLTDELTVNTKCAIINATKINEYGWSPDALFLLQKDGEIQNKKEHAKLWYRILGKPSLNGIPDDEFSDTKVFLKRAESICRNSGGKWLPDEQQPHIIMCFLPCNGVDRISHGISQELAIIAPDYNVVIINSEQRVNPRKSIIGGRTAAKLQGKKGVIVLSGRQCSLGVSLKFCDIVVLLNNSHSYDLVYQMMFRSMTERVGKKCGFIFDLSLDRAVKVSLMEYAMKIKPNLHPKKALLYLLENKIVNLNAGDWTQSEKNLSASVYEIYSADLEGALSSMLVRLSHKRLLLSSNEIKALNMLCISSESIKKGIKNSNQQACKSSNSVSTGGVEKNTSEIVIEKINYMEILTHLIPLFCILTIKHKAVGFLEMYELINNDVLLSEIFISQLKTWWAGITLEKITLLIDIFKDNMLQDSESKNIIRTVKELFLKAFESGDSLGKLIDTYFIPQEMEKKQNAEVSTPWKLRQEMLAQIPEEFWKSPKKVFEPCAGKGGFLLDILEKFMDGLQDFISDEKERKAFILENCIYWADINPVNIFICNLFLNSKENLKLNYWEGDTLKLDLQKQWDLESFDAVIGNPPYNKGKNSNFYVKFIEMGKNWLKENGLMLYVIPNRFLIPGHSANKTICELKVLYILHTTDQFSVSTHIGYFLAVKSNNVSNEAVITKFKDDIIMEINLKIPTPTANNQIEYKNLSDKILKNDNKIKFIKEKKEKMQTGEYLFIPRHWMRYCKSKSKGGKHVFNVSDKYGDDGRFISCDVNTKNRIIWYLSKSKIIRFITSIYASTVFIPPFIWNCIPDISFDADINDQDLYKLFGLTQDEITLIEQVID